MDLTLPAAIPPDQIQGGRPPPEQTVPQQSTNFASHRMGKRRRTPSVEARVVETKQKFCGSLENISFTLFTFILIFFHFHFFHPHFLHFHFFHFHFFFFVSSSSVFFYFSLIQPYFLLCSAFFA
jgi:hypothetical protein